jgi:hypothetical protein
MSHRLESASILDSGTGQHDPRLRGAITQEAVARRSGRHLMVSVPCMAVTSDIDTLQGRPSSWFAALGDASYGKGEQQRLLLLNAGNILDDLRYEVPHDCHFSSDRLVKGKACVGTLSAPSALIRGCKHSCA